MNTFLTVKNMLRREAYSCVIADRDRVMTSRARGIAPLLERAERGELLEGAFVADRIIGKAAAMLLVPMRVAAVYGEVMSREAERLLLENGIEVDCGALTDRIDNRAGDGPCPMEQAVADLTDCAAAPAALRARLRALSERASQ